MLHNSILHGSSFLADVDFTAVTANPVNYAVLLSLVFFFARRHCLYYELLQPFHLHTSRVDVPWSSAYFVDLYCIGCCCRGSLVFQVSRKMTTMILLDAFTFFLILWLNSLYLSEYLHLQFLVTHLTFRPQCPWQSVDLHRPSTEPYNSGILLH